MGTLRKMGAFLGLVPDDHQRYDRHHDGDDQQDGEFERAGYDGPVDTDAGNPSYDEPSWSGAHRASSYSDDAAADPHYDAATVGDEYSGRSSDHHDLEHHDIDHDRAPHGGERQPAFAGVGPVGRSSRAAGAAGASATDYRTQGALAVQPEARVETAAIVEPATHQKPATVSLTGFTDAREVGEFYRRGQAVILDMTELTDAEARRMVDFAAGLAFAVRGSIDKVTTKVFMLHPPADADR